MRHTFLDEGWRVFPHQFLFFGSLNLDVLNETVLAGLEPGFGDKASGRWPESLQGGRTSALCSGRPVGAAACCDGPLPLLLPARSPAMSPVPGVSPVHLEGRSQGATRAGERVVSTEGALGLLQHLFSSQAFVVCIE